MVVPGYFEFEIGEIEDSVLFMKKLQFGYNILAQKNVKKGIIQLDFLRCVKIYNFSREGSKTTEYRE